MHGLGQPCKWSRRDGWLVAALESRDHQTICQDSKDLEFWFWSSDGSTRLHLLRITGQRQRAAQQLPWGHSPTSDINSNSFQKHHMYGCSHWLTNSITSRSHQPFIHISTISITKNEPLPSSHLMFSAISHFKNSLCSYFYVINARCLAG